MAFNLGWSKPATAIEGQLIGQPLSIMEFESPSAAVIAEPVPIGSRSATWWLGGLVLGVTAVCGFAPLDVVITTNGKVVSTEDTVVIQPLQQSIIKTIHVRPGQVLKKGALLATLDPTLTVADLTAYRNQVAQLSPEVERLQDEKDGRIYTPKNPKDPNQALQLKQFLERKAQMDATAANYRQQIASLAQQISGNLAAAQYYRSRLGLANSVETMRKTEETQQVGSMLNTLLAADQRVQMEQGMQQSIASAQSEKATLQSTEAQLAAAVAEFNAQTEQTLSDTLATLTTAQQNLDKATLYGGLVEMRAPTDAVVLQVEKLSVGSVLQPGEQFIQLTPLDKPLEVETYVSGTDIGWVLNGDYAVIKFATFLYQEYGYASGHVTSVSLDSFLTPQTTGTGTTGPIITSTGGGDPGSAILQANSMSPAISVFYIARVAIDRVELRNVPKDFRVIPGMPVTVDLKVGDRTVLDYILGRVLPVFHEAMREP